MQRITSRMAIAAITIAVAASAAVGPQLSRSTGLSSHPTLELDDRRPPAQPCLIRTRNCLARDETPPAPCLVTTEHCPADGHVEFVDIALR
jgi:hypothetical protein